MALHVLQFGRLRVVGEVFGNELLQSGRRWVEARAAREEKNPLGVFFQAALGKHRLCPIMGPFLSLTIEVEQDLARAFLAGVEEALRARRGRFGVPLRRRDGVLYSVSAPPLVFLAQLLTPGALRAVKAQVASEITSGASTGAGEIELRTEAATITLGFGWPALVRAIDALFDPLGPEPLRGLGFPAFDPLYGMDPELRKKLFMFAAMSAAFPFLLGGLFG